MDWVCTVLGREEQKAPREEATVRRHTSESSSLGYHISLPLAEKIDDHIFEVCKPAGMPSVEIVFFFHGVQLEDDNEMADLTTRTLKEDQSECWLRWLQDAFPQARTILVSNGTQEIGESRVEDLVHSLTRKAQIGQTGCPVLLVGHCLGGLVIKELCHQAKLMLSKDWSDDCVDNFLINVKGLLFYETPNNNGSGIPCSEADALSGDLTTTRLNQSFHKLCKRYRWKIVEVAELIPADDMNRQEEFRALVVPQVSSTTHENSSLADVDPQNISSKHPDKNSSSFQELTNFMRTLLTEAGQESLWHNLEGKGGSPSSKPIGHDALAQEVEEKLRGQWRLGIVGEAGIGKTTLARAVFQNMSKSFEYTCFVGEVRKTVAANVRQKALQAKILTYLYSEGRKVGPCSWNWLRGKKLLLVMDDIDSKNHLPVMNSFFHFDPGSRLIVTSRNKGLLEEQELEIFSMERLSRRDSIPLFCLQAFKDKVTIPEECKKLLPRLIDKCDGLPLALKVVGGHLSSTCDWGDTLKRLCDVEEEVVDSQEDSDDELLAKLRISFDSLAPDEKQIFLDVATCFHGDDLHAVQEAWTASGCEGSQVWQSLLDKCLASECEEPFEEGSPKQVWMHDLLRDLGRSIALSHIPNVGEPIWVNGLTEAQNLLSHDQEKKRVKVLRIVDWRDDPTKALNMEFLSGLEELRILWLEGVLNLTGECTSLPNQLRFLKIRELYSYPYTFQLEDKLLPHLSGLQSLRCLMLNSSTADSIPESVGHLAQLTHLEIQCPNMKRLPESLGTALSLQRLHLIDCLKLQRLPESWAQKCQISDIGQLDGIRHLEITGCSLIRISTVDLMQLHALQHLCIQGCDEIVGCYELTCSQDAEEDYSVGNLTTLRRMTMKEWRLLKVLPLEVLRVMMYDEFSEPVDGFAQLQVLSDITIQKCRSTTLPESLFTQLESLQCLTISETALEKIPESVGLLGKLKKFTIDECYMLTTLSDAVGKLQALEELKISRCPNLRALPDSLQSLRALKRLTILYSYELTCLPESLGQLPSLQELTIQDQWRLQALPESLGHLQTLQDLKILQCDNLRALPESFENLRSLQRLRISFCRQLQALPDGLRQLPVLQQLTISDCRELRALPEGLGQLQSLEDLTISLWGNENCAPSFTIPSTSEMRALPESLGQLHALRHLTISRASELTALPESLGDLRALVGLTIFECEKLRSLPESLGQLQALEELTISNCQNLRTVPWSVSFLQALQQLKICGCGLRALPLESLGQLQTLQQLTIIGCCHLQLSALPLEFLGQLEALQRLEIADFIDLKALPDSLGDLQRLEHLGITGRRLGALPESLGQLQGLRELEISGCQVLRTLPESLGQLKALERLRITDCDELRALPSSCGQLQALGHLTIERCSSLKELPESVLRLRKLQHLKIFNCLSMEVLPEGILQISSLRSLVLTRCPVLRMPPNSFAELPPSLTLTIESCRKLHHPALLGDKYKAILDMNCGPNLCRSLDPETDETMDLGLFSLGLEDD